MPPEVKVRLSVDGTPEALAAFRAVQEQAHKTGRGASAGLAPFSNSLRGIRGLLLSMGGAFTTAALVRLGIDTAVAAREQGDLAKSLGTTTSNYSALNAVRKLANAPQDAVNKGLSIFADRLDALRAKEPATVATFKRLGLSAESFPSDDMALNLDVVARALMKYEVGGTRSTLATDAMGKSGKMLIPTLEKLVEIGGLEGAIAYARRTGQFIDQATVDMLEALTVSMGRLKLEAGNAALQIIEGFGPEAIAAISSVADAVDNQGAPAFERMGKFAGQALRGAIGLMEAAALRMEIVGKKWAVWREAFSAIQSAGGVGANPLWTETQIALAQDASNSLAENEKARRKVIEQSAQDESQIRIQELQAQQRDDDRAYSSGLMTLEKYLADRKQRIIRETSLAQGYLMMQVTTLQSGPLMMNDLAQVKAWEKQIQELEAEREARISAPPPLKNKRIGDPDAKVAAAREARAGEARLKALQAENDLLEATARSNYDAANLSLDEYYAERLRIIDLRASAELDLLTAKWAAARKIADPKARQDALDTIAAQTDEVTTRADIARAQAAGEYGDKRLKLEKELSAMAAERMEAEGREHELRLQRIADEMEVYQNLLIQAGMTPMDAAIEAGVRAGAKTARENFRDDLEKASAELAKINTLGATAADIDRLKELAAALREIATALGPDALKSVDRFEESIGGLRTETTFIQDEAAALKSGFAGFFGSAIAGFKGATDAARGFLSMLAQISMQVIATRFANWIFSAPVPGKGSTPVKSPGGGVPSGAGRAMQNLETINRSTAPQMQFRDYSREAAQRFSAGSSVQRAPAPVSSGAVIGGILSIELAEGLVARHAEAYLLSPDGQRIHVKVTAKNRRAIGQILR
jgi:hypothetical protein